MSTDKEKRNVLELLKRLNTNSVKERAAAVTDFFKSTTLDFDPEITATVVDEYASKAAAAVERGREYAKHGSTKKPATQKTYTLPGFRENGKGCKCSCCHRLIGASDARFFERSETGWKAYCALGGECHPAEKRSEMLQNPHYQKWIAKMSTKVTSEREKVYEN